MLGREHSGKVSKKFIGKFYFWGITLIAEILDNLSVGKWNQSNVNDQSQQSWTTWWTSENTENNIERYLKHACRNIPFPKRTELHERERARTGLGYWSELCEWYPGPIMHYLIILLWLQNFFKEARKGFSLLYCLWNEGRLQRRMFNGWANYVSLQLYCWAIL